MCIGPFAPPKMPAPPPLPPPPPEPPRKSDPAVRRARIEADKQFRARAGDRSTIVTGPQGLLTPEATGTTLLGGSV
jgi:hypothetical protein